MIFAGIPATVHPAGTDLVTTALAPITAPSPISMSPSNTQPQPRRTSSPTLGTYSPGVTPPPPRGTDSDVLEETAVLTHNGIGMNNAAQARMMEDARRVNLRPDTDIAAKEDAVHLPQQEGETVSELAVLIGLIGQKGNLEVLLIRHEHHLPQPIRI